MSKILEITWCGGCPFVFFDHNGKGAFYCNKIAVTKIINEPESIPDWCPLPDAPKEKKR